jgi:hypothetical protein
LRRVRRHLSFENVFVTAVAFVVLAGGTAFAASQLAKNSVGKVQLKANAVTTAKIKKNAVTAAKIKAGAVDGTKVKDGSLANVDLDAASLPFGRLVHESHSTASLQVDALTEPVVIPLENAAYTQEAGSDDSVTGSFEFSLDPSCGPLRVVVALVFLDAGTTNVSKLSNEGIVGIGEYVDENGGALSGRVSIGPVASAGALQPAAATNHTLTLLGFGMCKTGGGISVSNATVGVIEVKK